MFEYQAKNRFFAQIATGLQDLGIEELQKLSAQNISPAYRGIYFEADKATLYKINYMSRFITKVLAPLEIFPCHNTKYLYNKAKLINWNEFFKPHHTFAIFANVSNSKIRHSQYAALCLKDAIVDYFKESTGKRPAINTFIPDIWLNLHIENNIATINFDTSGGSLHRRNYRKETVDAPMQETLAAAIINFTEWDGSKPIYDPMCGSGTILSEALMYYCKIPPGFLRKHFGFNLLPDFDKTIWESVKKEADKQIRELPEGLISGSDISKQTIKAARINNKNLPCGDRINLKTIVFQDIERLENNIIVCNPPCGIRLGTNEDLGQLYKSFGDFLKQRCKGSTAYIYVGDRQLIPKIGLKPSWKKPLMNGNLDGRLVKLELY